MDLASLALYLLIALVTLFILSTGYFATKHKYGIPGPTLVIPLLGGIIDMVRDPYTFWEQQRQYAIHGVSWNSILGKYTLFSTKADHCQKIFMYNSVDTLTLELHPSAKVILGADNIAFMTGPEHKALRASFLHLFSPKALGVYLKVQERQLMKYIAKWIRDHPVGGKGKSVEMRNLLRVLAAETSQLTFVGPYLSNQQKFTTDFLLMTNGFLAAPIYLPGTDLWKAAKARQRVVAELEVAVDKSKKFIKGGGEPRCLLDFWLVDILKEIDEHEAQGVNLPIHCTREKMATTMMDFLFASQDATTAGMTWILATMSDNPDILQKVRQEQFKLRPHNEPITYDSLQEMTYARQVTLECLRYRPPAPMVAMLNHKDNLKIDDDLIVPKGTLLIPSIWASCMEGFPNPHRFEPDRMGPGREEDRKFQKQFIPFGVGPHRCVGYNYAIHQLQMFLITMATSAEWVRETNPKSNDVIYLPTLYPKDCICTWAPYACC